MKKPFLRLPGLLSVVVLLLFSTCQKDKLPPETQEGANTFGCKINGKSWVPNGGPGLMGAKPISGGFVAIYDDQHKLSTSIEIKTNSKNGETVSFYVSDYRVGNYTLNENTSIRPFSFTPKNYGVYIFMGEQFITNSKATGVVNITHADTLTSIISGTFSFRCSSTKKPNEVFEITNGRFDINMKTLR